MAVIAICDANILIKHCEAAGGTVVWGLQMLLKLVEVGLAIKKDPLIKPGDDIAFIYYSAENKVPFAFSSKSPVSAFS